MERGGAFGQVHRQDRGCGHCHEPRGAAGLRRHVGVGKPAHRGLPPQGQGGGGGGRQVGLQPLSPAGGAELAAGGHPLRRRAADAGRGAGADVPAQADDAGRTLPGPGPAGGAGHLLHHRRDQQAGRDGAADRAERQHGPEDRGPGLCAGNRQHHHIRHRGGAPGRRKGPGGVPGQEWINFPNAGNFKRRRRSFGTSFFFF